MIIFHKSILECNQFNRAYMISKIFFKKELDFLFSLPYIRGS